MSMMHEEIASEEQQRTPQNSDANTDDDEGAEADELSVETNLTHSNCCCCPYGYHIDLDFVQFSKSVLSIRQGEAEIEAEADWKEVEATQEEFCSELRRLSSEDELVHLQKKVDELTAEIGELKRQSSAIYSGAEACADCVDSGVQVTLEKKNSLESVSKAFSGGDAIEGSNGGTLVSRNVSRIPRLKSPKVSPPLSPKKVGPSEEMKISLSVLNEAVLEGQTSQNVPTAVQKMSSEWFRVAGAKSANPTEVKEYISYFKQMNYTAQIERHIVNMTDEVGNTALHYAVSYGKFDIIDSLLDSGVCDPCKLNIAGYTSMMLVALVEINSDKDRDVVRRLFSVGDVNVRASQDGQTALMLNAAQGRLDAVRLLVEAGADVNLQDEDGSTALMCAVEHGHGNITRFLLSVPTCDPSLADNDGYTALEVAMEVGNKEIAVILYAHQHFGDSPTNSSPRSETAEPNT